MEKSKLLFTRRTGRNRGQIKKAANGRLRLSVFRSSQHIYAQLIDDTAGRTLASASTIEKSVRESIKGSNIAGAKRVGELIGERAKAAGATSVIFDRGGYKYHGRVKALADAAREAGLQF